MSRSRLSVISNGVEADHFAATHASRHPQRPWHSQVTWRPISGLTFCCGPSRLCSTRSQSARLRLLTDGDFTALRALAEALGVASRVEVMAVDYAALPEQLRAATVLANPRPECSQFL